MLILTRKSQQAIDIGEDIEIKVCEIRGDKVRLGITAPRGIRVDRREITEIRRRMDRGEPLHEIEARLDAEENL